jgi:S1-C subfamily serine protease
MAEPGNWAFPKGVQPRQDELRFDLDSALDTVVQLRSEIPEDAFTASILGTERAGNGVVIRDDGLVLTIGYLITEARSIWLTTNGGLAVAGYPLAYDQATGFGLVQPLARLGVPSLPRGSASSSAIGDDVIVIGHGGSAHALKAKIIAKREFAGYWEYVLDEALFTAPAHPRWGGAAVVGEDGRLLGIGSLLVEEALDLQQSRCHKPDDVVRRNRGLRQCAPVVAQEAGGPTHERPPKGGDGNTGPKPAPNIRRSLRW